MLTNTIENVLNRGLPRSPRARELCAGLKGRRVAVDVRGVSRVLVESTGDSLKLSRDAGTPADAEVSGGLLALMALSGPTPEAVIQRGDVEIRGDTEVANAFRELARLLRPDIEEELALIIGDVPAHQLGRFARSAIGWSRRAASTTVRNVAEFFAHERGDLVSRPEGNQFLKGVDAVREDVDRLEARIEILAQQLRSRSPGKPDA
jgi:ubiquinone biosynthesis protein UbiJ